MKISIINGSQKPKGSNSGLILEKLNKMIDKNHETKHYKLKVKGFPEEILKEISSGDIIILAFPLYVDSIPTNVLKMLIEMECYMKKESVEHAPNVTPGIHDGVTQNIIVYALINNGFYEGKQTHIAFEILENWCRCCGMKFGGGIGQGGGETIGFTKNWPFHNLLCKNLEHSLELLAKKMESKAPFNISYLNPTFPRFLWKIIATHFFWYPLARKNKLKKKDLIRQPI